MLLKSSAHLRQRSSKPMTPIQSGCLMKTCLMKSRPVLRIDYQPLSVENVRDIRRYYIEVADNALALKVIKMIRTEISALSEQPNRAPAYDLAPNVRRLVVYN